MMKNPHPSRRRVYVLLGFFCAFLVLFFAVLYDAQVVHGSENRARSITSNTASETVTASLLLGRELAVSLPFAAAAHPLFRWAQRRTLSE